MKKLINTVVLVYIIACVFDICAPVWGPRGSDWNLVADLIEWALTAIE